MLYEREGQLDKSKEAYSKIKEKYPDSTVGRDIEKYIARIEAMSSAN